MDRRAHNGGGGKTSVSSGSSTGYVPDWARKAKNVASGGPRPDPTAPGPFSGTNPYAEPQGTQEETKAKVAEEAKVEETTGIGYQPAPSTDVELTGTYDPSPDGATSNTALPKWALKKKVEDTEELYEGPKVEAELSSSPDEEDAAAEILTEGEYDMMHFFLTGFASIFEIPFNIKRVEKVYRGLIKKMDEQPEDSVARTAYSRIAHRVSLRLDAKGYGKEDIMADGMTFLYLLSNLEVEETVV